MNIQKHFEQTIRHQSWDTLYNPLINFYTLLGIVIRQNPPFWPKNPLQTTKHQRDVAVYHHCTKTSSIPTTTTGMTINRINRTGVGRLPVTEVTVFQLQSIKTLETCHLQTVINGQQANIITKAVMSLHPVVETIGKII